MNLMALLGIFIFALIVGLGLTAGIILGVAVYLKLYDLLDYLTAPSLKKINGQEENEENNESSK